MCKFLFHISSPALEEVSFKHTSAHTEISCFWIESDPWLILKPGFQQFNFTKGEGNKTVF